MIGPLPGLVRINNIYFSRSPKIVKLLNEYDLGKEFGEGVANIYRDMERQDFPSLSICSPNSCPTQATRTKIGAKKIHRGMK